MKKECLMGFNFDDTLLSEEVVGEIAKKTRAFLDKELIKILPQEIKTFWVISSDKP